MLKKKKFFVGGFIVFLAIGYLGFMGFQSSATYYYTVNELMELKSSIYEKNTRVNGQVVPGSIEQEPGSFTLRFTIIDTEGGKSLPVVYQGVIPDTFKADNEVVIEGYLNPDDTFQAHTLLTKCPSRYVPEE